MPNIALSETDKYKAYILRLLKEMNSVPANRNPSEYANDQLTRLNLKMMLDDKHPLFVEGNPGPLPVDIEKGWVFSGPTGLALDLYAIQKGYNSRSFISVEEAERLGIDHLIKDFVNISLHDKYRPRTADETKAFGANTIAVQYINIDTYKARKDILSKHFPDIEKQDEKWNTYVRSKITILQENKQLPDYRRVVSSEGISTADTLLPKFSVSLKKYELCRMTKQKYTPEFTKEELLKEIALVFQKHPKEALRAFQQSAYTTDRFLKKIFTKGMSLDQAATITSPLGVTMTLETRHSEYITQVQNEALINYENRVLRKEEIRPRTHTRSR